MKRFSITIRSIAAALSVCFFSSLLTPPVKAETIPAPKVSFPGVHDFQIPQELGKVSDRFEGSTSQSVLLIQDAHSIPEAQRHIRKILEHLRREYGITSAAVEGASSELDARLLRTFPNKAQLETVVEQHIEKGEISGPVASAILGMEDIQFQGVEDWELFEKGLGLYLATLEEKEKLSEKLLAWENDLHARKQKNYSEPLLEADRLIQQFESHSGNLSEILLNLSRFKKPASGSLLEAILREISKKDNEPSEEAAVKKIAAQIQKRLPAADSEFQQQFQRFNTSEISAAAFAAYLAQFLETRTLSAEGKRQLQTLHAIGLHVRQIERMEGPEFLKEFETYSNELIAGLLQTEVQKEIFDETAVLKRAQKWVSLELSRDEWRDLQGGNLSKGELEAEDFALPRAFYENAEQRERAFLRGIERMNQKQLMMVAGGFHSQGLIDAFRAKGISYALITPRVAALPEHIQYENHMRGDVSWKNYYEGQQETMNLYDGFMRAMRDRLLQQSSDTFTVKFWRDEVIRHLAGENKSGKAGQYTRFLDEITEGGSHEMFLERLTQFTQGLRILQSQNRLTPENILGILSGKAIPSALTGTAVLTSAKLNSNTLLIQNARKDLRAELRIDTEFEMAFQGLSPGFSREQMEEDLSTLRRMAQRKIPLPRPEMGETLLKLLAHPDSGVRKSTASLISGLENFPYELMIQYLKEAPIDPRFAAHDGFDFDKAPIYVRTAIIFALMNSQLMTKNLSKYWKEHVPKIPEEDWLIRPEIFSRDSFAAMNSKDTLTVGEIFYHASRLTGPWDYASKSVKGMLQESPEASAQYQKALEKAADSNAAVARSEMRAQSRTAVRRAKARDVSEPKSASSEEQSKKEKPETQPLKPVHDMLLYQADYGFMGRSSSVYRFIQDRLRQLMPDVPEKDLPQIEVLSRKGEGVNAMAFENNAIILSPEIIEFAESAEEIDFVLLHEINHILQGHHAESAAAAEQRKSWMTSLGLLRFHEYEADMLAFYQMADSKRKSNPMAAIHFLERLNQGEGSKEWDAAHGALGDRILNLKSILGFLDLLDLNEAEHLTPLEESLKNELAVLEKGGFLTKLLKNPPLDARNWNRWQTEVTHILQNADAALLNQSISIFYQNLIQATTQRREEKNNGFQSTALILDNKVQSNLILMKYALAKWNEKFERTYSHLPSADRLLWKVFLLEVEAGFPIGTEFGPAFPESLLSIPLDSSLQIRDLKAQYEKQMLSKDLMKRVSQCCGVLQTAFPSGRLYGFVNRTAEAQLGRFAAFDTNEGISLEDYLKTASDFLEKSAVTENKYGLSSGGSFEANLQEARLVLFVRTLLTLADLGQLDSEAEKILLKYQPDLSRHSRVFLELLLNHSEIKSPKAAAAARGFLTSKGILEPAADFFVLKKEAEKLIEAFQKKQKGKKRLRMDSSKPEDRAFIRELARILQQMSGSRYTGPNDKRYALSNFEHEIHDKMRRELNTVEAIIAYIHFVQLSESDPDDFKTYILENVLGFETVKTVEEYILIFNTIESKERTEELYGLKAPDIIIPGMRKEAATYIDSTLLDDIHSSKSAPVFFKKLEMVITSWPFDDVYPEIERPDTGVRSRFEKILAKGFEFLSLGEFSEKKKAYYSFLLSFAVPETSFRSTFQVYFLKNLLEQGSFEEALTLLFDKFKVQGPLGGQKGFETVIEQLAETPEQLEALKEKMKQSIGDARLQTDKAGVLLLPDYMAKRLIKDDKKKSLLNALLTSAQGDEVLREWLLSLWVWRYEQHFVTLSDSDSDFYKAIHEEGMDAAIGYGNRPRLYKFPHAILQQFYTLDDQSKYVLLRLLLTGKGGVLETESGRGDLARQFLDQYLKQGENTPIENLLTEVITGLFESAPVDELYLMLNPLLISRVANPPAENKDWSAQVESLMQNHRSFQRLDKAEEKIARTRLYYLMMGRQEKLTPKQNLVERLRALIPEDYFSRKNRSLSAIEMVIEIAQQLGAPGVRFLQLLGQTFEIPEEYRAEFSQVYDSLKGQSKIAAWESIKRYAPDYASQIKRLVRRVGGGSLFTVYKVELKDGTYEVVRVMNPNALYHAKFFIKVLRATLEKLSLKNSMYQKALPLVDLIERWITEELLDLTFEADDILFREKWNGWSPAPEFKTKIIIPEAKRTGSIKVRPETYIQGFHEAQGIHQEDNLTGLQNFSPEKQKELVSIALHHYLGQLMAPINEKGESFVHSDISGGNLRVDKDGNLAILDRGRYLKFTAADREFLKTVIITQDPAQKAALMLDWVLNLDENGDTVQNLSKEKIAEKVEAKLAAASSPDTALLDAIVILQSENLKIPLHYNLLFKNLNAFRQLAVRAGFNPENPIIDALNYDPSVSIKARSEMRAESREVEVVQAADTAEFESVIGRWQTAYRGLNSIGLMNYQISEHGRQVSIPLSFEQGHTGDPKEWFYGVETDLNPYRLLENGYLLQLTLREIGVQTYTVVIEPVRAEARNALKTQDRDYFPHYFRTILAAAHRKTAKDFKEGDLRIRKSFEYFLTAPAIEILNELSSALDPTAIKWNYTEFLDDANSARALVALIYRIAEKSYSVSQDTKALSEAKFLLKMIKTYPKLHRDARVKRIAESTLRQINRWEAAALFAAFPKAEKKRSARFAAAAGLVGGVIVDFALIGLGAPLSAIALISIPVLISLLGLGTLQILFQIYQDPESNVVEEDLVWFGTQKYDPNYKWLTGSIQSDFWRNESRGLEQQPPTAGRGDAEYFNVELYRKIFQKDPILTETKETKGNLLDRTLMALSAVLVLPFFALPILSDPGLLSDYLAFFVAVPVQMAISFFLAASNASKVKAKQMSLKNALGLMLFTSSLSLGASGFIDGHFLGLNQRIQNTIFRGRVESALDKLFFPDRPKKFSAEIKTRQNLYAVVEKRIGELKKRNQFLADLIFLTEPKSAEEKSLTEELEFNETMLRDLAAQKQVLAELLGTRLESRVNNQAFPASGRDPELKDELQALGINPSDIEALVFPFVGFLDLTPKIGDEVSFIGGAASAFDNLKDIYLIDSGYTEEHVRNIQTKLEKSINQNRGDPVKVHILREDYYKAQFPVSSKTIFIDKFPGDSAGTIRRSYKFLETILAKPYAAVISVPPMRLAFPAAPEDSRFASIPGYRTFSRVTVLRLTEESRKFLGDPAAPSQAEWFQQKMINELQDLNFESVSRYVNVWNKSHRLEFMQSWYSEVKKVNPLYGPWLTAAAADRVLFAMYSDMIAGYFNDDGSRLVFDGKTNTFLTGAEAEQVLRSESRNDSASMTNLIIKGIPSEIRSIVEGEIVPWEPKQKRLNISLVRPHDRANVARAKVDNEIAGVRKIWQTIKSQANGNLQPAVIGEITQIIEQRVVKAIKKKREKSEHILNGMIIDEKHQGGLSPEAQKAIRELLIPALINREEVLYLDETFKGNKEEIRKQVIERQKELARIKIYDLILNLPYGLNAEDSAFVVEHQRHLADARRSMLETIVLPVLLKAIGEGKSASAALREAIKTNMQFIEKMKKTEMEAADKKGKELARKNRQLMEENASYLEALISEFDTHDFIYEFHDTKETKRQQISKELARHEKVLEAAMQRLEDPYSTRNRTFREQFSEFVKKEIDKGRSLDYAAAKYFALNERKITGERQFFMMHYYNEHLKGDSKGRSDRPIIVLAKEIRHEKDYRDLFNELGHRGKIVGIVTVKEGFEKFGTGHMGIMNGKLGTLLVDADLQRRKEALALAKVYKAFDVYFERMAQLPVTFAGIPVPVLGDETEIEMLRNRPGELSIAQKSGMKGVGLLRIEELFADPKRKGIEQDEARTRLAISELLSFSLPIYARLFDVAPDKRPQFLTEAINEGRTDWNLDEIMADLTGARFYLSDDPRFAEFREFGKRQLRALFGAYLQSAPHAQLRIFMSDVRSAEEVHKIEKLIVEAKKEFIEGLAADPKLRESLRVKADNAISAEIDRIPFGYMFEDTETVQKRRHEIMAAVAEKQAERPAPRFFGIGSNDLYKTILRDTFKLDPFRIPHWYIYAKKEEIVVQVGTDSPVHLNGYLVRDIANVAEAAEPYGFDVTLEGEWGGSIEMINVLMALRQIKGLKVTPVAPTRKIPEISDHIRLLDREQLEKPLTLQGKTEELSFNEVIRQIIETEGEIPEPLQDRLRFLAGEVRNLTEHTITHSQIFNDIAEEVLDIQSPEELVSKISLPTKKIQKILVADDEYNFLNTYKTFFETLEGGPWEVVYVEHGVAAMEAVREANAAGAPFDLVITDRYMYHDETKVTHTGDVFIKEFRASKNLVQSPILIVSSEVPDKTLTSLPNVVNIPKQQGTSFEEVLNLETTRGVISNLLMRSEARGIMTSSAQALAAFEDLATNQKYSPFKDSSGRVFVLSTENSNDSSFEYVTVHLKPEEGEGEETWEFRIANSGTILLKSGQSFKTVSTSGLIRQVISRLANSKALMDEVLFMLDLEDAAVMEEIKELLIAKNPALKDAPVAGDDMESQLFDLISHFQSLNVDLPGLAEWKKTSIGKILNAFGVEFELEAVKDARQVYVSVSQVNVARFTHELRNFLGSMMMPMQLIAMSAPAEFAAQAQAEGQKIYDYLPRQIGGLVSLIPDLNSKNNKIAAELDPETAVRFSKEIYATFNAKAIAKISRRMKDLGLLTEETEPYYEMIEKWAHISRQYGGKIAGLTVEEPTKINVAKLLNASILSPQGVQIFVDIPVAPVFATLKEVQFLEVLINIIKNATEAMEGIDDGRKPEIRLTLREEGDFISLKIRDNGPGLPEGFKEKIEQGVWVSSKGIKGNGIGLPTSRDHILKTGGTFSVNSEKQQPGKPGWTEFTITLPKNLPEDRVPPGYRFEAFSGDDEYIAVIETDETAEVDDPTILDGKPDSEKTQITKNAGQASREGNLVRLDPRQEARQRDVRPLEVRDGKIVDTSQKSSPVLGPFEAPQSLAFLLNTLGSFNAAGNEDAAIPFTLKPAGRKFFWDLVKIAVAANVGNAAAKMDESEIQPSAFLVWDDNNPAKAKIPYGILFQIRGMPVYFDFTQLSDPYGKYHPKVPDAHRHSFALAKGDAKEHLGKKLELIYLLERITLRSLNASEADWISEQERRAYGRSYGIASLFTINEIEEGAGKKDIFLQPQGHGSADFQTLLFVLAERHPEFFTGVVGIGGLGTIIDSLLAKKFGATALFGSELYPMIKSLADLNFIFARESGQIPADYPVKTQLKNGIPEEDSITTLLFNMPSILKGKTVSVGPRDFEFPPSLTPATGSVTMTEEDAGKILTQIANLLKKGPEKKAIIRFDMTAQWGGQMEVQSYLTKVDDYLRPFGLGLAGYYGSDFIQIRAREFTPKARWQYTQQTSQILGMIVERLMGDILPGDLLSVAQIKESYFSARIASWFLNKVKEDGIAAAGFDTAELQAYLQLAAGIEQMFQGVAQLRHESRTKGIPRKAVPQNPISLLKLQEYLTERNKTGLEVGGNSKQWVISTEEKSNHKTLKDLAGELRAIFPEYDYKIDYDARNDQNFMRLLITPRAESRTVADMELRLRLFKAAPASENQAMIRLAQNSLTAIAATYDDFKDNQRPSQDAPQLSAEALFDAPVSIAVNEDGSLRYQEPYSVNGADGKVWVAGEERVVIGPLKENESLVTPCVLQCSAAAGTLRTPNGQTLYAMAHQYPMNLVPEDDDDYSGEKFDPKTQIFFRILEELIQTGKIESGNLVVSPYGADWDYIRPVLEKFRAEFPQIQITEDWDTILGRAFTLQKINLEKGSAWEVLKWQGRYIEPSFWNYQKEVAIPFNFAYTPPDAAKGQLITGPGKLLEGTESRQEARKYTARQIAALPMEIIQVKAGTTLLSLMRTVIAQKKIDADTTTFVRVIFEPAPLESKYAAAVYDLTDEEVLANAGLTFLTNGTARVSYEAEPVILKMPQAAVKTPAADLTKTVRSEARITRAEADEFFEKVTMAVGRLPREFRNVVFSYAFTSAEEYREGFEAADLKADMIRTVTEIFKKRGYAVGMERSGEIQETEILIDPFNVNFKFTVLLKFLAQALNVRSEVFETRDMQAAAGGLEGKGKAATPVAGVEDFAAWKELVGAYEAVDRARAARLKESPQTWEDYLDRIPQLIAVHDSTTLAKLIAEAKEPIPAANGEIKTIRNLSLSVLAYLKEVQPEFQRLSYGAVYGEIAKRFKAADGTMPAEMAELFPDPIRPKARRSEARLTQQEADEFFADLREAVSNLPYPYQHIEFRYEFKNKNEFLAALAGQGIQGGNAVFLIRNYTQRGFSLLTEQQSDLKKVTYAIDPDNAQFTFSAFLDYVLRSINTRRITSKKESIEEALDSALRSASQEVPAGAEQYDSWQTLKKRYEEKDQSRSKGILSWAFFEERAAYLISIHDSNSLVQMLQQAPAEFKTANGEIKTSQDFAIHVLEQLDQVRFEHDRISFGPVYSQLLRMLGGWEKIESHNAVLFPKHLRPENRSEIRVPDWIHTRDLAEAVRAEVLKVLQEHVYRGNPEVKRSELLDLRERLTRPLPGEPTGNEERYLEVLRRVQVDIVRGINVLQKLGPKHVPAALQAERGAEQIAAEIKKGGNVSVTSARNLMYININDVIEALENLQKKLEAQAGSSDYQAKAAAQGLRIINFIKALGGDKAVIALALPKLASGTEAEALAKTHAAELEKIGLSLSKVYLTGPADARRIFMKNLSDAAVLAQPVGAIQDVPAEQAPILPVIHVKSFSEMTARRHGLVNIFTEGDASESAAETVALIMEYAVAVLAARMLTPEKLTKSEMEAMLKQLAELGIDTDQMFRIQNGRISIVMNQIERFINDYQAQLAVQAAA